ncbi:nucleoside hydrolase [Pseudonocardia sp. H11422]|uniref:nucleoside hydrolase n=1 Tax=Pseudonocardia sp. H11422 TaxID=2835866 RepID=UPI001BDDC4EA|nr:nucleoside hydrolase [Pseudonocardia sp. H11422]
MILDVDTGNDDAVALTMAALHPDIELVGCTTVVGNLTLDQATDNTLRVLHAIGKSEVEVHAGLARRFAPSPYPSAPNPAEGMFHQDTLPVGVAGLTPHSWRGVEWLIETLRRATDPITLIQVAPLTNLAAALTVAPDVLDSVDEVILMGGAWKKSGNRTPAAEFNIHADPVAADVVFRAGIERLTVAPLDATHEVLVSRDDLRRYQELETSAAQVVSAVTEYYIHSYQVTEPYGIGALLSAPLHDALCVAYAIDPAVLELTEVIVDVETVSPQNYGRTTIDYLHEGSGAVGNARFAVHADSERFHRILDDCLKQ